VVCKDGPAKQQAFLRLWRQRGYYVVAVRCEMDAIAAELLKNVSERTEHGELEWTQVERGIYRAPFDEKLTLNLYPYADFPADHKASLTVTEGSALVMDLSPQTEMELAALRVLYRRVEIWVQTGRHDN
jgi:hypothetical protein